MEKADKIKWIEHKGFTSEEVVNYMILNLLNKKTDDGKNYL